MIRVVLLPPCLRSPAPRSCPARLRNEPELALLHELDVVAGLPERRCGSRAYSRGMQGPAEANHLPRRRRGHHH
jgi:hypothetical protein